LRIRVPLALAPWGKEEKTPMTNAQTHYMILAMSPFKVARSTIRDLLVKAALAGIRMDSDSHERNKEIVAGLLRAYEATFEDGLETIEADEVERRYREFYSDEWARYKVGDLHEDEGHFPYDELPRTFWPVGLLRNIARLDAAYTIDMKRQLHKSAVAFDRQVADEMERTGASKDEATRVVLKAPEAWAH